MEFRNKYRSCGKVVKEAKIYKLIPLNIYLNLI